MSKFYDLLKTLIGKVNASVKAEAQALTAEQQAQARTNIAAMKNLSGYGNQIIGFDPSGNPVARTPMEYEVIATNTNKIYWDGVIGDRATVAAAVTVSNRTYTYTFVQMHDSPVDISVFELGYTFGTRGDDGVEQRTYYADASNITNPFPGVHCINGLVYIVGYDYTWEPVPVTIYYNSVNVVFPDVGVYFVSYDDGGSKLVAISAMSIEAPNLSVDVERRKLREEYLPESVESVVIRSSTEGSTKKFKLTIDDSMQIGIAEITT